MIFFKINKNLNIKLTDGNMVEYKQYKKCDQITDENIYATTYEDFKNVEQICQEIEEIKIKCTKIEKRKSELDDLVPTRLGLIMHDEPHTMNEFEKDGKYKEYITQLTRNRNIQGYMKEEFVLLKDVRFFHKIDLAIIGICHENIGEIINFCTALRILHKKLKAKCKNVKIDVFLQGSSHGFYKRDKEIYGSYDFINEVKPLGIDIKNLKAYNYCINLSNYKRSIYYEELPYVDFFLKCFGCEYEKINQNEKFNEISLRKYKPNKKLQDKLKQLKRNKLLLFHPYASDVARSMPEENAKILLDKLAVKSYDYKIVTTLKINSKNTNFEDLSSFSNNFFDFVYIISKMDKIISVDTSTYHISDALFIPTIALFTKKDLVEKRTKYYKYVKPIKIKEKVKHFSKFLLEGDLKKVRKNNPWKKLKALKLIGLLESIR